MSNSSLRILLPTVIALSTFMQFSPTPSQAMDPPKQILRQEPPLSPLLQVFLTYDWDDQFKAILENLDGGDINSLLIATGKHETLSSLRNLIKTVLEKKYTGWYIYDLDTDDLSPFSCPSYIARCFYLRLIDLINASEHPLEKQSEAILKMRYSLQGFLNGAPSLKNHSAHYLLKHWEHTGSEIPPTNPMEEESHSTSEILLLLYAFAKRTPFIPDLVSDPYDESRIQGIMMYASAIASHTLKQEVFSFLDATQLVSLGEWFNIQEHDNNNYLDRYQSLHDARECFLLAQKRIEDKIWFAKLNQHVGETYIKETQLLVKQGLLDTALEIHQQALFYFLQPEPTMDTQGINDQNRITCYRISNHRAIYRCLKLGAKLYLKTHQKSKALNNLKLAREIFAPWVDEEDSPINTSEKLTALQNIGLCYSKEAAIHNRMKNEKKALNCYQQARNIFHAVLMEQPGFNAVTLEYHLALCHQNEGTIYYIQGLFDEAFHSYDQAQTYFTQAMRMRGIFRHWKAQYGLASCLMKQLEITRLLRGNDDIDESKDINTILILLPPILQLSNHHKLQKKTKKLYKLITGSEEIKSDKV